MPVLLIVRLAGGQTDTTSIRRQEAALVSAIRTRDKASLARLTDANFHVSWDCGSAVKNFHIELSREEWVDDVSRLRINSYATKIAKIRLHTGRRPDSATVKYNTLGEAIVAEHLQIGLLPGGSTAKDFIATDAWAKQAGTWKLAARFYGPEVCQDSPQLAFPANKGRTRWFARPFAPSQ